LRQLSGGRVMYLLSAGWWPVSAVKMPAQIAGLVVAALVSGCASTTPGAKGTSLHASDEVGRFAGLSQRPSVEIEDDGREAQLPPRRRSDPFSDNPAEPFSPNYGSVEPASAPSPWTATIAREHA
jgi:hypothetical protein